MRPGSARASGSGNTATRATDAEASRARHKQETPQPLRLRPRGSLFVGTRPSEKARPAFDYFETALNAFTWPWPLNEL